MKHRCIYPIATLVWFLGTQACGTSDGGAADGGSGSHGAASGTGRTAGSDPGQGEAGYAPSRFEFVPGPPGRATGIRALVEVGGQRLETGEIEVRLLGARPGSQQPREAPEATDATRADEAAAAAAVPPPQDTRPADFGVASQALCSTRVGEAPEAFETLDGEVCWLSMTLSAGTLVAGGSYGSTLFVAKEGLYQVRTKTLDVYYPPDLFNFSENISAGCVISPTGETTDVAYLAGLTSLGVSVSVGNFAPLTALPMAQFGPSVGLSMLIADSTSIARGMQYDVGIAGASIGVVPFPISLRYTATSEFARSPVMVERFANACGQDAAAADAEGLRALADEALGPALEQLRDGEGYGPGRHMMAGSNADAWQSLGGAGLGQGCDGCPPSTMDDILRSFSEDYAQVDNDAEAAIVAAEAAAALMNVLPSRMAMDQALRGAVSGVQLLGLSADSQRAADVAAGLAAPRVVIVDAVAGEPVSLEYTADELAALVGAEPDAVLGATLTVDGSPIVSPADYVLDEPVLQLSFTPKSAVQILMRARVDLTTAAGPIPEAALARPVELSLRLVRPKAGPPALAVVDAAGAVASGGAITLSAAAMDEHGNIVDAPARVRFVDADGEDIGVAETTGGVATLQYVPVPSQPEVTRVTSVELEIGDETLPGIRIEGKGLSLDAEVYVDGALLDPELPRGTPSSAELLIAHAVKAGTPVHVVNPGGLASDPVPVSPP